MAIEVGNSNSWYKPTSYGKRGGSFWATGKNTAPDRYTEEELKRHYDFCYNEPVSKMRPDKELPSDANEQRYDWVFNIRSGEGRWQLHNPNGLNAHRDGLDPYDWDDQYTKSGSTSRSKSVKSLYSSVGDQSFDSAFKAAVKENEAKAAPVKEEIPAPVAAAPVNTEESAEKDSGLSFADFNRSSAINVVLQQVANAANASSLRFSDILTVLGEENDDEKNAIGI